MDEQKIKKLIKGWYNEKAKNETEPVFKFLCLWICFNAWLAYCSNERTDRKMIVWLVRQTASSSELIRAYERKRQQSETFKDSLKSFAEEAPIGDSRGRSNPSNSIEIVNGSDRNNIINGIYKVRCNLFHGGKAFDDSRDQKLVALGADILDQWIGNLIDLW